jgi:adenosylcobinamide kinase / adenosylcobinamide-phosphate guanylyltransferase
MAQRLIFLLGGARSGKSHYAETWARENGKRILYVATAQALDDEMRERIDQHRFQRPAHWQTLEAPLNTGAAIRQSLNGHDTVVLDCITLLASNILLTLPEDCSQSAANQAVMDEAESILAARHASDATWLIVSNEVGMGLVPPYRLGRLYRDALGYANQRLALAADDVLLFVAGLPWKLK